jgi:hypothetical protein
MKAISIQQPWAGLIVRGDKLIENRSWSTSYRGPFLIHASKRTDNTAPKELLSLSPSQTGGIIGIAILTDVVTHSDDQWFRGPYGFVLNNPRKVPFIPLRGQLGVFDTPITLEEIESVLRFKEALK